MNMDISQRNRYDYLYQTLKSLKKGLLLIQTRLGLEVVVIKERSFINKLVENARKFRESAPNQIPIFRGSPPPVGVSENVWFCMV